METMRSLPCIADTKQNGQFMTPKDKCVILTRKEISDYDCTTSAVTLKK